MFRWGSRIAFCVLSVLVLLFCSVAAVADGSPPGDDWNPTSRFEGKFDWVQMTSGEWVKGEIIVMYEDDLEFDSDEFDELTLGWDDIRQIHSAQVMTVGFNDGTSFVGILILDGDSGTLVGEGEELAFNKVDVLSITAGAPKEINFWTMKIFVGAIVRQGNSDVKELNFQAGFKRRTVRNRVTVDFVGNANRTDGESITDNQRASAAWDKFINKRLFVKPIFGEYYRDPFQNIAARYTIGVGAGYELMDTKKVDWSISGGPAYQETRFDSVVPPLEETENTPALVVGTTAEWDITKWLEFDGSYRFQVVNEESGTYNHHMVISFETDITKLIDFDVSWIWDRIEDPTPNADGIVPEQDDFQTTVGLTFEW